MGRSTILFGVAFVPAFSVLADPQPKYDLKLEKAAMEIVAARIGDIRPGFGYGQTPMILVPPRPPAPIQHDAIASWRVLNSDGQSQARSDGGPEAFPGAVR